MVQVEPVTLDGLSVADGLKLAHSTADAGRGSLVRAREIYRLCCESIGHAYARGRVRQKLWQVEQELGHHRVFFSQAGQDRFLYKKFFSGKKNGVFVEIGGHNGWSGSNCLFFEKFLNWTGVIVEASPTLVQQISRFRTAPVVHAALSDVDGRAEFIDVTSGLTQMSGLSRFYPKDRIERVRQDARHQEHVVEVPTLRLDTLLTTHGLTNVDYCSIDVEGAERAILSALDFHRFDISVFSIENGDGTEAASAGDILAPAGYRLIDVVGADEIWAK